MKYLFMELSKSGDTGKSFDHQTTKPPNHQTTKTPKHKTTKTPNDKVAKLKDWWNIWFLFSLIQGGVDFSGCETQDDGSCCVMREEEVTTLQKEPLLGPDHLISFWYFVALHDWNFVLLQIFQPMTPQVGRYPERLNLRSSGYVSGVVAW